MYIENKNHALAIMKYANMRGTASQLEHAFSTAFVGKHHNGWCKIDDDLFWNEVLLKDTNCLNFLENHRILDLEELVVRYIQWDIDFKLKEKNWWKDYKNNWKD
jgi:hypothetical protein